MTVARALKELAAIVGAELARGDPSTVVSRVAPIESATADSVTFVTKPKYLASLKTTQAGAVMISPDMLHRDDAEVPPETAILTVRNPYVAFARAAQALSEGHAAAARPVGIHPSCVVDPSAKVGAGASMGPFVVVGPHADVGAGVVLYAGVHLGAGARVGEGSILYDHVVVKEDCSIGARCIIHSGAVIGADGFGFAQDRSGAEIEHVKIPQVGNVVVEDDVEIGANSCVDRAALGSTRIGAGSKIDNLVQIAHNVDIGPRCIVIAQAGIAGSSRLGRRAIVAAQAGVAGHLEIGEGATVFAQAGVMENVPAGGQVLGTPARPKTEFFKTFARVARLDTLVRRVKKLEGMLGVDDKDVKGEG